MYNLLLNRTKLAQKYKKNQLNNMFYKSHKLSPSFVSYLHLPALQYIYPEE